MSRIDEAAVVIRQLQAALGLNVSMVASGEQPSHESTSTKLDAQQRAQEWLDSLELPKPVRDWQPHQQRVWVEKQELDVKATKLSEFIAHSQVFEELPFEEQHLLREQCEAMWQYSHFLGKRIERFFMVDQLSESAGLTLDKLAAVVEANESINWLAAIEITDAQDDQARAEKAKKLGKYWQEPEAVTVSVSMAPGAEPLSAEKFKELDAYIDAHLEQQTKQRGSPKLFNVQDSEHPAFVIAHSFEEALAKWKVAVAEENATDSEYEEVPPAGIMHVCDGDELIIERGFADKANS